MERAPAYLLVFGMWLVPIAVSSRLFDNYTVTKWVAVYGIAGLYPVLLFASRGNPLFPKLRSLLPILLGCLFTFFFCLFINPSGYRSSVLDWICFAVLFLAAFRESLTSDRFASALIASMALSAFPVIVYGTLQFIGIEPFPFLTQSAFPSSFFGYQNMTAEFMGMAVLSQVFFLYRPYPSKILKVGMILLLLLSLVYMIILGSRAAILAITLGMVPFLLGHWSRIKSLLAMALLSFGLVFLAARLNAIPNTIDPFESHLQTIKAQNTHIRWIRWRNTLCLIKANPWGIGPGRFEFGYLPYHGCVAPDPESNESMVVKSPHNGYLEATAENGILFFFALSLLILAILRNLFLATRKYPERKVIHLGLSIFCFILTDALFAFPMENAYPFFATALILGLSFSFFVEGFTPQKASQGFRLALVALTAFILTGGSVFLASSFLDSDPKNYRVVSVLCEIFPENWRLCMMKSEIEMDNSRTKDAEKTLRSILKHWPHHFPAIRSLAFVYLAEGKIGQSCSALKEYDELFYAKSSLHSEREKICP